MSDREPKRARLSLATLNTLPLRVAKPQFNPAALGCGIVHLGVGAFHRAHQCVYTEDAINAVPGDWGIIGISLRRPNAAQSLMPQDCLYTIETRSDTPHHRIIGTLRSVLTAGDEPDVVKTALASDHIHIITLTVTEKGYGLGPDGALSGADIEADLSGRATPISTLGWLMQALSRRYRTHRSPLTVMSCDNVALNSHKLRSGLLQFARHIDPEVARWIEDCVRFPNTMVDCIVPATDDVTLQRVEEALGLIDAAPVQREPYAQWVIENDFAGPRPAWEAANAQIVNSVSDFERLKLHVLNATHSALAYLGLPRGHTYVREAIADPEILHFLDEMVRDEIAPALAPLPVVDYWDQTKSRYRNPSINHALAQIAEDGSKKLSVRIYPLLIANVRAGRPAHHLAGVVRAWLDGAGRTTKDPEKERLLRWAQADGRLSAILDDPALFPSEFRADPRVRTTIVEAFQSR